MLREFIQRTPSGIRWILERDEFHKVVRGATDGKLVMSPRTSTWENPAWFDYAKQPEFNNFYDTFNSVLAKSSLLFTPRYGFGTAINAWAVAMQDMVGGDDVEERLSELADEIREELE